MWKPKRSWLLLGLAALQFSAAPAQVIVSTRFECLWWNEAQMAKFDPNHPPSKETRVTLKRWEYTDPVGVPHPDVVELVVEVRNDSNAPAKAVAPVASLQWLEGAQVRQASARWTGPTAMPKIAPFDLNAGETRTLRLPIDVAGKMKALETAGRWPWALRILIVLPQQRSVRAEFPIRPGD